MLRIENTDVYGFAAAIRGMRSPMNSWDQSDSGYCDVECCDDKPCRWNIERDADDACVLDYHIGEKDMKLMTNLAKAGSDHAKYLRMINVTMDVTAPLYWWKEFDTYKVGTVANSCSTMHKIHSKEFTEEDFSWEHLYTPYEAEDLGSNELSQYILIALNRYRERYLQTRDKRDWWQMIQLLPSSYNQRRTVQLNYEVLRKMYFARRNHKLDCWHTLCDWMLTLPYFKELCVDVVENS